MRGAMTEKEQEILKKALEASGGSTGKLITGLMLGVEDAYSATAISQLHDRGYLKKTGSNPFAGFYLTELGKLQIIEK